MSVELLLKSHLKTLKLPTILQEYVVPRMKRQGGVFNALFTMRVGPSKSACKAQASNRLKLRGLRVPVVSVKEKA